jgi:hypothetical protein
MAIVDECATAHNELLAEQQRIDALWVRLNGLRDQGNHQDNQAVSLDFASHWDNFATAFVYVNQEAQSHYARLMAFHQRHGQHPESPPPPRTSTDMDSEDESVSDSDDSDSDENDNDNQSEARPSQSIATVMRTSTTKPSTSKATPASLPRFIPEEADVSDDSDESMEPGEIAMEAAPLMGSAEVSRSEPVGECMVGGKLRKVRQVVRQPVAVAVTPSTSPLQTQQPQTRVLRSGKHLASPSLKRS